MRGTYFIVRDRSDLSKGLLALLVLAPAVAGCSGASEMFQSDLLSKDAEWFSRSGRLFIRSISIDTPPLTPEKAVAAEDLVSAAGACPGMAPPGGTPDGANALAEGADTLLTGGGPSSNWVMLADVLASGLGEVTEIRFPLASYLFVVTLPNGSVTVRGSSKLL